MDSERKRELRDRVVNRACIWLDCRNTKNGLTGQAKEDAKGRQRVAENDLAAATEQFQKES